MPTVITGAPIYGAATAPDGTATRAWTRWFQDVQALVNSLATTVEGQQSAIVTLQSIVASLGGGPSVTPGTGGITAYPLGGGDTKMTSNLSAVWMTVPNPQRVRVNWTHWYGTTVIAFVQVHSDASMIAVTPRLVAVDEDGAVTRVVWTGTAAYSTGRWASGWSPIERAILGHGSGEEDLVLQVYTPSSGALISATGYLECGGSPTDIWLPSAALTLTGVAPTVVRA